METLYEKAQRALHQFVGEGATFRDGQFQAIQAVMTNQRTLVVQRTGWGKSMVYFVCTKLKREQGRGLTLIISPLLSLMNNQVEAAARAGLRCDVLNSSRDEEQRREILAQMMQNQLDMVLTTPETLFSDLVQNALPRISIGLLVIDEAHCISDWGHDFRLSYCRLKKVVDGALRNVPILATTATANNRVQQDLVAQLGGNVCVVRGPLTRENLSIQILKLGEKTERYAWMLDNIPKLPGAGIVYCLTQLDCQQIAGFLNENGISAKAYHSGLDEQENVETEKQFMDNAFKVLCATVKLGMGYDKGDIAFVIHYQMPQNLVAYYQQIGRAGRNIPRAYTFLMSGREDLEIHEFFRESAFPTEEEYRLVYNAVLEAGEDGAKRAYIMGAVNKPRGRIEKALDFLLHEDKLYREKRGNAYRYFVSANRFSYDADHYRAITATREQEQQQMMDLLNTRECLSQFVLRALDDDTAKPCGLCTNCRGNAEFPETPSQEALYRASSYLEKERFPIEPRKMWEPTAWMGVQKNAMCNEPGICLSRYGHPIYGQMVKVDKYITGVFRDELVEKSAAVLKDLVEEQHITALTYVPSNRSSMVEVFAGKLAGKLDIPCLSLLGKTNAPARPQREMENSAFQCKNACQAFQFVGQANAIPHNLLLVDDIVDSRWTMTVCGYLLRENGAQKVFPFALANASKGKD